MLEVVGAGRAIAESRDPSAGANRGGGVRRPRRTSSRCRSAPRLSAGLVTVVASSLGRTQTSERSGPCRCCSVNSRFLRATVTISVTVTGSSRSAGTRRSVFTVAPPQRPSVGPGALAGERREAIRYAERMVASASRSGSPAVRAASPSTDSVVVVRVAALGHPARRPEQAVVAGAFGTARDPGGQLVRPRARATASTSAAGLAVAGRGTAKPGRVERPRRVLCDRDDLVAPAFAVDRDPRGRCDDVPAVASEVDVLAGHLP